MRNQDVAASIIHECLSRGANTKEVMSELNKRGIIAPDFRHISSRGSIGVHDHEDFLVAAPLDGSTAQTVVIQGKGAGSGTLQLPVESARDMVAAVLSIDHQRRRG